MCIKLVTACETGSHVCVWGCWSGVRGARCVGSVGVGRELRFFVEVTWPLGAAARCLHAAPPTGGRGLIWVSGPVLESREGGRTLSLSLVGGTAKAQACFGL